MTIAWAIVVVAALYFLDKHHLLKKSLVAVAILVVLTALCYSAFVGYQKVKKRWEFHQFAKANDCVDLSTRKVHPISESGPYCDFAREELHMRGTPLPIDEYSTPIPQGATSYPGPKAPPRDTILSGKEFLLRRPGSDEYLRAICFDEVSGQVSSGVPSPPLGYQADQVVSTAASGCKGGSILMEEVK
jgi:hypothetical protein